MSFFGDIGDFFGGLGKKMGGTVGDIASLANMPYGVTRAALSTVGNLFGNVNGGAIPPLLAPPLPPDATDEQIRQAVLMQRRRLLLGQGQGSTFVSGPLGDTSSFMTAPNKAGGF